MTLNSNAVRCCLEVSLKSWKARDPSQKTYHDTYLEEQLSWVSWAFDTFALYFKRVSQTWLFRKCSQLWERSSDIGCEAKIGDLCDLWHQVKKIIRFPPVCCHMRMSFPGFLCKKSSIGLDLTKLRTSTWPSPDATERGVQPWRIWDNRAAIWCKVGKWPALEFVQIWFPFWSSLQSFQTL